MFNFQKLKPLKIFLRNTADFWASPLRLGSGTIWGLRTHHYWIIYDSTLQQTIFLLGRVCVSSNARRTIRVYKYAQTHFLIWQQKQCRVAIKAWTIVTIEILCYYARKYFAMAFRPVLHIFTLTFIVDVVLDALTNYKRPKWRDQH